MNGKILLKRNVHCFIINVPQLFFLHSHSKTHDLFAMHPTNNYVSFFNLLTKLAKIN